MRSTVLLAINNEQNIIPSITSVLESNFKPSNFCIALNSGVSDNIKGIVSSFLKSCCDGSEYTEEYNKDCIIAKKSKSDCNIFSITSTNPVFDAYKYIKSQTDIFITMTGRSRFNVDYIENILSLFDDVTGAVYSDFYFNGKRIYLESVHPFNGNFGNIAEIAFKKNILEEDPKFFNCPEIISKAYSKSLIRHIPKALYAL
jgi:hypothetical protein